MNIFRKIKDFEDYEVDNDGNVKSLRNDITLKPQILPSGYCIVGLCKNGKHYYKRIHRLVAEAFLPNPLGLPYVNHRDENKLNNRVWINEDGSVDYEKSNLEWCDAHYNNTYNGRHLKVAAKLKGIPKSEEHKAKLKNHPNKSKQVVAVDKNNNVVYEFASVQEAGRNGFDKCAVSACCRNCYHREGNRFFKGYHWYFKEDWLTMQKNASPHRREDA